LVTDGFEGHHLDPATHGDSIGDRQSRQPVGIARLLRDDHQRADTRQAQLTAEN